MAGDLLSWWLDSLSYREGAQSDQRIIALYIHIVPLQGLQGMQHLLKSRWQDHMSPQANIK